MSPLQETIKLFMELGQQHCPKEINFSHFPGKLRADLVMEEAQEFQQGCANLAMARNLEERELAEAEIIDAICDILWVSLGAACAAGVDLTPFMDEVNKSNLSKVDGSLGPVKFREDGKVIKPEGWKNPDILRLLKKIKYKESLDRVSKTYSDEYLMGVRDDSGEEPF